jgi:hypothetical protein
VGILAIASVSSETWGIRGGLTGVPDRAIALAITGLAVISLSSLTKVNTKIREKNNLSRHFIAKYDSG